MKNVIKCGIFAAVLVAAGFTAYQSYSSYGVQDNSLLMQNVEALAQSSDGGDGDANGGGFLYPDRRSKPKFCRLYVYTDASGKVIYSSTNENVQLEASGIYYKIVQYGLKEDCPDKGSGCTPFHCIEVSYE